MSTRELFRDAPKREDAVPARARQSPAERLSADSGIGRILKLQESIGNQAVRRRATKCPSLSACPTGGACHPCGAAGHTFEVPRPGDPQEPWVFEDDANTPDVNARAAPVAIPPAAVAGQPPAGDTAVLGAFIAADDAQSLAAGQMRRSAFLGELRREVCQAAEDELSGTGRSTGDCPWIEYWFGYYSERDAEHIERALRHFAPEAASATSARDYLGFVTARVRRSVGLWATTGVISGIPAELSSSQSSPMASPPSTAPIARKPRADGGPLAANPLAIQNQLGAGQPLEGRLRSRLEPAFGADLSQIRVHSDAQAARLSSSLKARAFTLGRDVAFDRDEYRPNTPLGDALIAHEIAHSLQQRSDGDTGRSPLTGESSDYDALERDADHAAAGTIASLWGVVAGTDRRRRESAPLRRSGLRIQRCKSDSSSKPSGAAASLPTVSVGNFRATDGSTTSAENKCALCPATLGIPAATGTNYMELRGDVTGHTTSASYDFKRTKEGGVWKKVGGAWTQMLHLGPGNDDDSHDSDEDLVPENDHIYVIDGPGFSNAADPVQDASATEAVLKGSFVEWVNARLGTGSWSKVSNEFEWHSIAWLEKVGGTWARKAGKNEIATGSTTVGTGDP